MFKIEDVVNNIEHWRMRQETSSAGRKVLDYLLAGQSTDIKDLKPPPDDTSYYELSQEEGSDELKVWDNAKYGTVVDRFTKNYIDYVVVMFDHPGNPPSNYTKYIYLAPQGD